MLGKNTHLQVTRSKAPKTQQLAATDIIEKPVGFLWHRSGVDFCSWNNFTNLSSFSKVSIPVVA